MRWDLFGCQPSPLTIIIFLLLLSSTYAAHFGALSFSAPENEMRGMENKYWMLFLIAFEIIPTNKKEICGERFMLIIYGVLWFIEFSFFVSSPSVVSVFHVVWAINLRRKLSNVIKQKCTESCKSSRLVSESGSFGIQAHSSKEISEGLLSRHECLIRDKFLLLPCALISVALTLRFNRSIHKSLWLVFQLKPNYLFMKSETINSMISNWRFPSNSTTVDRLD